MSWSSWRSVCKKQQAKSDRYLVVITEKLTPFRTRRAAVAPGERSHTHTHTRAQSHIQNQTHMHKRTRFGLCFELIPNTAKADRRLGDNKIILWPSYGNVVLLLWRKYEYYGFQRQLRELHGCHAPQLQWNIPILCLQRSWVENLSS